MMRREESVGHAYKIYAFELTNKCPMRCIMCPRTHDMTRPQGLMAFELYQKCLDEYVRDNPAAVGGATVWLHGFGESMMHPEFDQFVGYAKSIGVPTGFSVNPIMLSDDVAERLLRSGPQIIWMALDGHDNASFQKIRGVKNAYDRSKANLIKFMQRRRELRSDTVVTFNMINFEENRESIEKMRDFWKDQGIDDFQVRVFCTFDGSVQALRQLDPNAESKLNRKPLESGARCKRPWTDMVVCWDGVVTPCCFDHDTKYPLGDASRQSLREIWNGEPMRALRREFMSGVVENKLCANCDHLWMPVVTRE